MSNVLETLYTFLTGMLDLLHYCWDFLNDGISFISTSFTWLIDLVGNLPAAVSGFCILFIVLGVLCLIFNR